MSKCVQLMKIKKWREVAVNVMGNSASSAASAMRKIYTRYLFEYECAFERGGIDPHPIINQIETAAEDKRIKTEESRKKKREKIRLEKEQQQLMQRQPPEDEDEEDTLGERTQSQSSAQGFSQSPSAQSYAGPSPAQAFPPSSSQGFPPSSAQGFLQSQASASAEVSLQSQSQQMPPHAFGGPGGPDSQPQQMLMTPSGPMLLGSQVAFLIYVSIFMFTSSNLHFHESTIT